jgi:5-methylcytosine-specific restriction endonuclease McrA
MIDQQLETKVCLMCKTEKPITSFYRKKAGYQTYCKECQREYGRPYRKKFSKSAKGKAAQSRYWESEKGKANLKRFANSEKGHEYHLEYQRQLRATLEGRIKTREYNRIANKKPIRKEQQSKYWHSEKGIILKKEKDRKYKHSPLGLAAAARSNNKRKRMKDATISTLTVQQWEELQRTYKYRCVYCGEKKPLTQDHIIPLSKGGNHMKENVIPACRSCNAKKSNHLMLNSILVQAA